MNETIEKMSNEQMPKTNFQECLRLSANLDKRMSHLRECYRLNQTQIKEAESKSASAIKFESLQEQNMKITRNLGHLQGKLECYKMFQSESQNSSSLVSKEGQELKDLIATQFSELKAQIAFLERKQKKISVALNESLDAVKYLTILGTRRNREKEISEEGFRLKIERQNIEDKIEESKFNDLSKYQNNKSETSIIIVEEKIICKVGLRCLRLAEFLFSSKICKEVFYPMVGDWREE